MKRLLPGLLVAIPACTGSISTEPQPYYPAAPAQYTSGARWVPLATNYTAQTDRQSIAVQAGPFRKLRVEAVRGAPMIQQVAIEYENRQTQVVKLNQQLPPGRSEVIDLNRGEPIHRIIVYTEPGYGGAYSVYGT